ncbi:MAG: helix-hairpin-helix domain-containing protein [Acidobacteriota bacterium]
MASTLGLVARQELPEGKGQDVTLRLCSNECHGIDKVVAEHKSKSQWIETMETMRGDGAKGTDEEFKIIIGYLATHYGVQIKINKATVKQIDDALVLAEGQADAIVKYRDANGPFVDLAALLKVPGLDPKAIEIQKDKIVF